jgi:SAM-dependent methyltransferase
MATWSSLLTLAQEEYGRSSQDLHLYFTRLLRPSELDGLKVLEVGSGNGLASFLMAESGADVTALDPLERGSNDKMNYFYRRYESACTRAIHVHSVQQSFQDFDERGPFDLILSHNSINHLDEVACTSLESQGRESYEQIFAKFSLLLRSNGRLWIADCARHNLWGQMRVRNPFVPSIDWSLHHEPRTWMHVAQGSGFREESLEWNVPSRRLLSRVPLILRRGVSYSISSHFTLRLALQARPALPGSEK